MPGDASLKGETNSLELVTSKPSKKSTLKGFFKRHDLSLKCGHDAQQKSGFHDVDAGGLTPRITFNVGGVIFQTFERTVKNIPTHKTPDLSAHYDNAREEYFFDRDPDIFRCVLNYWRTGSLHLPLGRCGPSINHELELWGLEELDIEPCCWTNFNAGLDTAASLENLRRDALQADDLVNVDRGGSQSGFCRNRLGLWCLLTVPKHSKAAKVYECFSILVAILAIFSFCAATTSPFRTPIDNPAPNSSSSTSSTSSTSSNAVYQEYTPSPVLTIIDYVCLGFFTLEFLLLTICAPSLRKFLCSVRAVIDILAILPDYIEFIVKAFGEDGNKTAIIDILQMLRLMRVIRIFRVIRRVSGLWIMIYTLKASYKDLFLMLLFLLAGTLLFGSVIYFADDIAVFTSIPHSFWWAIVTMTTVGYGDMVPTKPWGQIVAFFAMVCGVLLIGFTIPSLVNNFIVYSNLMQFDARQRLLISRKVAVEKQKNKDSETINIKF